MRFSGCIGEPERVPHIMQKENQEDEREIHKVAMNVLNDEREGFFAPVRFARLADGTGWRIGPTRFVICPAIVVAGHPKSAWRPRDEQSGRPRNNPGPPRRLRAEPASLAAENLRRIERRQIWPEPIMIP